VDLDTSASEVTEPLGNDPDSAAIGPVLGSPRSVPVIVGFDYGTHSTKVIVRRRGDETAKLARIEPPAPSDDYPVFACPSLVRLTDGVVHFGGKALRLEGGDLYRSLKVRLLPPSLHSELIVQPRATGGTYPPDLLVALYFSWALGGVKKWLDGHYGLNQTRPALNVAAPMDHVENPILKARYLRIIRAAWDSVFGPEPVAVSQGTRVAEVIGRFEKILAEDAELPGLESRQYEVLPETLASIVCLSAHPGLAPGFYMVADMGAGTTEASVNRLGTPGPDQRIVCYQDESIVLGGDRFKAVEDSGASVVDRGAKINTLVIEVERLLRRTWKQGYDRDEPNHFARPAWQQLGIVLTGGGARRREVYQAIELTKPADYVFDRRDTKHDLVGWLQPTGIDYGKLRLRRPDIHLLAVAFGLSKERQKWPEFFVPNEVERQQATEVCAEPVPHWYADR
jgi:hypothetical protein